MSDRQLRSASRRQPTRRYREYSGPTGADRPKFVHKDPAFDSELAQHCAFPSLDMNYPGPGPSQIWKEQKVQESESEEDPVIVFDCDDDGENSQHSQSDGDYSEMDSPPCSPQLASRSNRLILTIQDMSTLPQASHQHNTDQDGDTIMPSAAGVEDADDENTGGSSRRRTGPRLVVSITNRPKSPSPPCAGGDTVLQEQHPIVDSQRKPHTVFIQRRGSRAFTDDGEPTDSASGTLTDVNFKIRELSQRYATWPELSPGVKYIIIYEMTQGGLSFTRAINQLGLLFEEATEMIELVRVETGKIQKINKDLDKYNDLSNSAWLTDYLSIPREPLVTDMLSKHEIQRGKSFLSYMSLHELAAKLGYYEGSMGSEFVIPLNHFIEDGWESLLPQFRVGCPEEVADMWKASKEREKAHPRKMSQAELLVRMDAPPGTINPGRISYRSIPEAMAARVYPGDWARGLHPSNYDHFELPDGQIVKFDDLDSMAVERATADHPAQFSPPRSVQRPREENAFHHLERARRNSGPAVRQTQPMDIDVAPKTPDAARLRSKGGRHSDFIPPSVRYHMQHDPTQLAMSIPKNANTQTRSDKGKGKLTTNQREQPEEAPVVQNPYRAHFPTPVVRETSPSLTRTISNILTEHQHLLKRTPKKRGRPRKQRIIESDHEAEDKDSNQEQEEVEFSDSESQDVDLEPPREQKKSTRKKVQFEDDDYYESGEGSAPKKKTSAGGRKTLHEREVDESPTKGGRKKEAIGNRRVSDGVAGQKKSANVGGPSTASLVKKARKKDVLVEDSDGDTVMLDGPAVGEKKKKTPKASGVLLLFGSPGIASSPGGEQVQQRTVPRTVPPVPYFAPIESSNSDSSQGVSRHETYDLRQALEASFDDYTTRPIPIPDIRHHGSNQPPVNVANPGSLPTSETSQTAAKDSSAPKIEGDKPIRKPRSRKKKDSLPTDNTSPEEGNGAGKFTRRSFTPIPPPVIPNFQSSARAGTSTLRQGVASGSGSGTNRTDSSSPAPSQQKVAFPPTPSSQQTATGTSRTSQPNMLNGADLLEMDKQRAELEILRKRKTTGTRRVSLGSSTQANISPLSLASASSQRPVLPPKGEFRAPAPRPGLPPNGGTTRPNPTQRDPLARPHSSSVASASSQAHSSPILASSDAPPTGQVAAANSCRNDFHSYTTAHFMQTQEKSISDVFGAARNATHNTGLPSGGGGSRGFVPGPTAGVNALMQYHKNVRAVSANMAKAAVLSKDMASSDTMQRPRVSSLGGVPQDTSFTMAHAGSRPQTGSLPSTVNPTSNHPGTWTFNPPNFHFGAGAGAGTGAEAQAPTQFHLVPPPRHHTHGPNSYHSMPPGPQQIDPRLLNNPGPAPSYGQETQHVALHQLLGPSPATGPTYHQPTMPMPSQGNPAAAPPTQWTMGLEQNFAEGSLNANLGVGWENAVNVSHGFGYDPMANNLDPRLLTMGQASGGGQGGFMGDSMGNYSMGDNSMGNSMGNSMNISLGNNSSMSNYPMGNNFPGNNPMGDNSLGNSLGTSMGNSLGNPMENPMANSLGNNSMDIQMTNNPMDNSTNSANTSLDMDMIDPRILGLDPDTN